MQRESIHGEYSYDGQYRFIVCRMSDYFEVWVQKKVIDEYTIEMFGRRGWICDLCNNFNYDTRKKCNRCHILKKPKRIEDYLLFEKSKNFGHKQFWHCKYCGNYNYAFRLVCNRCQAKKEVA